MSSVHGEGDDPQDNDQGQDEGEAVDVEPPGLEVLTELQGPGTKPAIREHPDHDEASQHRESLYYNTDLGGSVSVHCVRGQRLQVIYYMVKNHPTFVPSAIFRCDSISTFNQVCI